MIVELLARLHATFWERLPANGSRGPLGWVYSASGDHTSLLTGPLLNTSARRLAERTSIPVEDGRFIIDNYRAVAKLIDRQPNTVTHGDAHPGNVYFRNGEAGLLDWQAVRRGHPGRELSYTLITGMTTADRQVLRTRPSRHLPARPGRRRRPRTRCRRTLAALPARRAVRLRRTADHRRDGRHAGRKHCAGRRSTRRGRADRSGDRRRAEAVPGVVDSLTMRMTVLGSGGWIPTSSRQTSCYLVTSGTEALILDAGTGFGALHIDPSLLDGVETVTVGAQPLSPRSRDRPRVRQRTCAGRPRTHHRRAGLDGVRPAHPLDRRRATSRRPRSRRRRRWHRRAGRSWAGTR